MAENEPTIVAPDGVIEGPVMETESEQPAAREPAKSDGPDYEADVAGLRKALQSERKLKREAEGRLAEFADIRPDEAREALKAAAKAREAQSKTKDRAQADMDARLAQIEAKHEKESGKWGEREKFLLGQIERNLVDSAATTAIAACGADVALLTPHVKAAMQLDTDADGNYSTRVVGENGEPLVTRMSGKTGDMSVQEFVDTVMREKFPAAFPGTGASGTGATGVERHTVSTGAVRIDAKTARNALEYRRAKEKAQKLGVDFIVEQDEIR